VVGSSAGLVEATGGAGGDEFGGGSEGGDVSGSDGGSEGGEMGGLGGDSGGGSEGGDVGGSGGDSGGGSEGVVQVTEAQLFPISHRPSIGYLGLKARVGTQLVAVAQGGVGGEHILCSVTARRVGTLVAE
jgi:hypothetical protein